MRLGLGFWLGSTALSSGTVPFTWSMDFSDYRNSGYVGAIL